MSFFWLDPIEDIHSVMKLIASLGQFDITVVKGIYGY